MVSSVIYTSCILQRFALTRRPNNLQVLQSSARAAHRIVAGPHSQMGLDRRRWSLLAPQSPTIQWRCQNPLGEPVASRARVFTSLGWARSHGPTATGSPLHSLSLLGNRPWMDYTVAVCLDPHCELSMSCCCSDLFIHCRDHQC